MEQLQIVAFLTLIFVCLAVAFWRLSTRGNSSKRAFTPDPEVWIAKEGPRRLDAFRGPLEDFDYSQQDLMNSFINKSLVKNVSFENSSLSGSRMCWNDFEQVNFKGTSLSECDMRASIFEDCDFEGADLTKTDLRRSSFVNCRFKSANFEGAKIAKASKEKFDLSPDQIDVVEWMEDDGEEPEGG